LNILSDILKCAIIDLKLLLIILIILSIISSILIYLLTSSTFNHELQFVFSNWIIDISAGLALVSSFMLILRERIRKSEAKKYVSLFIGILLWFSAEIIYTYYQTILKIDLPYPSYADILWLLGYIFVGYHLYSAFHFWNKNKRFSENSVFIITIFTALLIHLLVQSSIITYSTNIELIFVDILYHILDGIILIPSIVLLCNLHSEHALFTHRTLISLFVILNTFANIGYIFSFNLGRNIAIEYAWIWDIVYNFSYILLAGALFWYDKLLEILNKNIEQSIIAHKNQFQGLLEKHDKSKIIENNNTTYLYIDKEKIKDTVNTLISNAKSEILLLIYIQNKYNHNTIKNLNLLFTNSNTNKNNNNNLKIRILFDISYNLKLLLSTRSTDLLNIQYRKIAKSLRSDMIFVIIEHQHLIFIDLKQQYTELNQLLAIYSTNNNSILQFNRMFENLWALSELKEQSDKYNE
jgi:hypothetical protein